MADLSSISGLVGTVTGGIKPATTAATGSSGWTSIIIIICIFFGIAIISIAGTFIWFFYSEKRKWQITTRVHYENPTINGVKLGNGVLTKRIRFKNGIVVYMYKTPIQGYTISPELLTWSAPREHDIIVTQDKKLFCIVGTNSIDTQRKKLEVDISYPDIEMDRQDLQKHIDSKSFDDPNDKLKLIAKVATYLFICITIIVLTVLIGKSYVDGKNADAGRDVTNLKTAEYQAATIQQLNTFLLIMNKVMPQSFSQIDGINLLNQTLSGGA